MALEFVDTLIGFSFVMLLLSLLTMIAVQFVSSLLNLRGRGLRWGLQEVLKNHPALRGKPEEAAGHAESLLRNDAISQDRPWPLRWASWIWSKLTRKKDVYQRKQMASVIRFREFVQLLSKNDTLALTNSSVVASIEEKAASVASQVSATLPAAASHLGDEVQLAIRRVAANAKEAEADLRRWFDMTMDRTTERFVSHTRIITVIAALLLVMFFRVDALVIFREIQRDPEIRAQLVTSAAETLNDGNEMMQRITKGAPIGTEAITYVRDSLPEDSPARNAISAPPPDERSPKDAGEWMAQRLAGQSDSAALMQSFNARVDVLAPQWLSELRTSLDGITASMGVEGLTVFHEFGTPFDPAWREAFAGNREHLWGMVVAWLLVSLGAPFWFNTMRQFMTLKPVVARKEEEERKRESEGSRT